MHKSNVFLYISCSAGEPVTLPLLVVSCCNQFAAYIVTELSFLCGCATLLKVITLRIRK